jgi:hypothetical protein
VPFAEEFINAFLAGQQARENRQIHEQRTRQMQYEAEDRDVEKQLLQHRLKELKLTERLQAREQAQANLKLLSGTKAANIPQSMAEETPLPQYQGGGLADQQGVAPFQFRPVTIPGIEPDLLGGTGVPEVQVRPETEEDQLANILAQARIKAANEVHPVAYGGGLVNGLGQTLIAPQQRPEPTVDIVTGRDKAGNETRQTLTREEARKLGPRTLNRIPPRASQAAVGSNEDLNAIADQILAGQKTADTTGYRGGDRLKLDAIIARRGYNTKTAIADEKALATHYQTLNSGQRADIQVAANTLEGALDDLETAQMKWQGSGKGPLSRAAIVAAKAIGGDSGQAAKDFEAAVANVQEALAVLRSGGSGSVNTALAQAEKDITTGSNIPAAIKRLRDAAKYRIRGVRSLEAILPSQAGGDAEFDYDPTTGSLVPRKK